MTTLRQRLSRLPLRIRLVLGFAGAMLVVLIATAGLVFWRVQVALDHRLNDDLRNQTAALAAASRRDTPDAAIRAVADRTTDAQVLGRTGEVLASGAGVQPNAALLTPDQAGRATADAVQTARGNLLSKSGAHLRIRAVPVRGADDAAVAVTAVRLDARDEALRELLAQLAIANLLALVIASYVGYRLAHAALDPVEDYRAQAARIAAGDTGVRLEVPAERDDEITRLGTTLNHMLESQERAVERQRQFIDDASHELRTPLTVLGAEIEVTLRTRRRAPDYEAALGRLAQTTRELTELTDTLLTLGAVSEAPLRGEVVRIADLLADAAGRAQRNGRTARSDAEPALQVRGDATLLARALANLVDNATHHGDGTITLRGETREGHVILSVHDEGHGMAPEFLPHAAERFRREGASRTGPGTGLGLALVDAIAAAHGGRLRVCSAGHHSPASNHLPCRHPEGGTTVSILIPVDHGPARPDPSSRRAREPGAA